LLAWASPPWARAIVRTIARPRPEPPRAGVVDAREALERGRDELRRKAGPLIVHAQPERVVALSARQVDLAGAVAQRVLDEIAERLLESARIGRHADRRTGDRTPVVGPPRVRVGG